MNLSQLFFFLLILLLPTQLGRHFWPKWSYIYGLRVDYLSPTFYLTDLMILGTLISWGFENITNVKRQTSNVKSKSKILKLIILFSIFIYLFLNCFFAQNQGAAIYKFLRILEFFLLGVYVAKNSYLQFTIYNLLSLSVIYSSLIAIAQFYKQSSLGGIFWWLGERSFNLFTPGIARGVWQERLFLRPYGTFSHPNSLAGFILVGLILTFPVFFKKNKIFSAFLFFPSLLTIIISFSRTVWVTFFLLLIFWGNTIIFRKRNLFLITILFFIFFGFLLKSTTINESLTRRLELNKEAIYLIKQSFLGGVGLNNSISAMTMIKNNLDWTYRLQPVHNIYLLVATETGLIGLGIFLWFIFLSYKKLIIKKDSNLIIALFVILFLGFFDHYWLTLQQNQILLTIILGFCYKRKRNFSRTNLK